MGSRRPAIALLSLALTVPTGLAVAARPVAALAPTIAVDEWADELNADGDCSLREAIETINTGAAVDACGLPASPIIDIAGPVAALGSTLSVSETMTIRGTTALPASINCSFVVGNCIENVGSGSDLDLENLWISMATANQVHGELGAGHLHLRDVNVWGGSGGVVSNDGEVSISHSTVWNAGEWGVFSLTGDVTIDHSAFGGNVEGAVYADIADLAITASTIYQNDGYGVFGQSAAIDITSSTIAENGADATRTDSGTVTIRSSTIVDNRRAANVVGSGETRFSNTVVAGSGTANCSGAVVSAGYNVADDGTCAFGEATDRTGIDPQLGAFDTMAASASYRPLPGSPLVDTGGDCPATDQLDAARPTDSDGNGAARCEVGSIETAAVPSTPDPTDPPADTGDTAPAHPTATPATPVAIRPTFTG